MACKNDTVSMLLQKKLLFFLVDSVKIVRINIFSAILTLNPNVASITFYEFYGETDNKLPYTVIIPP